MNKEIIIKNYKVDLGNSVLYGDELLTDQVCEIIRKELLKRNIICEMEVLQ